MKPTPEQIKQIAIECEFASLAILGINDILFSRPRELQAFFTRAYELGWKNRGESENIDIEACASRYQNAIRNNTEE